MSNVSEARPTISFFVTVNSSLREMVTRNSVTSIQATDDTIVTNHTRRNGATAWKYTASRSTINATGKPRLYGTDNHHHASVRPKLPVLTATQRNNDRPANESGNNRYPPTKMTNENRCPSYISITGHATLTTLHASSHITSQVCCLSTVDFNVSYGSSICNLTQWSALLS